MATKFDLNDLTPAAPAGRINIQWQFDATGNVSAHVPSVAAHQTPWLSDIDADQHDLNDLGVVRLAPVTIGEVDPSSGLVGFGNEEGTLHVLTGNGGSINLESIGNGRVMISTDSVRRIVVAQNGNVGIGPSMNPTYTLDVQGTCNVSGALTVPLSVQSALFKSSADMVFQVGAGFPERVRINAANGNVGIGTNNAQSLLHVKPATNSNFLVGGPTRMAGSVSFSMINDAASANVPLELRALPIVLGTDGYTLPSHLFSGVVAYPSVMMTQADTGTASTASSGPLVLINPDPTSNNLTSVLFATLGSNGSIYGNAQVAAQFMSGRIAGYCPTDLLFLTGVSGGPTERMRIASDGTIQMFLGGLLKTLSVDGSGFVKAT